MKIRSQTELNQFLSQALAWRKQDISNINRLIESLSREHEASLLRRSAVLFLYAHFEGFTKESAEAYIDFVSRQRLAYERLTTNFVAICARPAIRQAGESNLMRFQTGVVEFLTYNQRNTAKFTSENTIDTESNVNARVFGNILDTVGIPIDDFFSLRMLVLDGGLLAKRNAIAHGEKIDVTEVDYRQLRALVVELLDHFRDCLENAAVLRQFERK